MEFRLRITLDTVGKALEEKMSINLQAMVKLNNYHSDNIKLRLTQHELKEQKFC